MSIISYDQTHKDKYRWGTETEVMAIYEEWLVKHDKFYNGLGEKEKRFQIFKDNLRHIDGHNAGNHSYKLGLNRFADLTNEEFLSIYLGTKQRSSRVSRKAVKSNRYAPIAKRVCQTPLTGGRKVPSLASKIKEAAGAAGHSRQLLLWRG